MKLQVSTVSSDSVYLCIVTLHNEYTDIPTDYWEQCIAEVISMLLGRWKRLTEHLVQDVQLENVWVSLRTASRSREKPDQTPGSADRGGRTPGEHQLPLLQQKSTKRIMSEFSPF